VLVQFIETFRGWPDDPTHSQGLLFSGPYYIESGDLGLLIQPMQENKHCEVLVGNLIFRVPVNVMKVLSDGGHLN